jgi:hypothetical protein
MVLIFRYSEDWGSMLFRNLGIWQQRQPQYEQKCGCFPVAVHSGKDVSEMIRLKNGVYWIIWWISIQNVWKYELILPHSITVYIPDILNLQSDTCRWKKVFEFHFYGLMVIFLYINLSNLITFDIRKRTWRPHRLTFSTIPNDKAAYVNFYKNVNVSTAKTINSNL